MKYYEIYFEFPDSNVAPFTGYSQATTTGRALARAWFDMRRQPQYRGRKGMDNGRISVRKISEEEFELLTNS